MTDLLPKKCIVFGCPNWDNQGTMQGELCMPCYIMLTTAAVSDNGLTFIHSMKREASINIKKLQAIRDLVR